MSVANKKKVDCSGCNACAEICPKDCIGMVKDAKGFFYPKVETDICIHCELCVKVCPLGKGNVKLHTPLKAFAAWNRDRNQHLASTSGGAAHVLSSYIIKMGGVVYGCTSEDIHIRQICAERCVRLVQPNKKGFEGWQDGTVYRYSLSSGWIEKLYKEYSRPIVSC